MITSNVHPNRGATVPDTVAVGKSRQSQSDWLVCHNISTKDRIRLKKLSHMRYQHPELDEIERFLIDFGMQVSKKTENEIWFKGYGSDHYVYYARKGPKQFLGGAFEAESQAEFNNPVQDLRHTPGGGFMVTVTDPEGFPINVVIGSETLTGEVLHPEKIVLNYVGDKPRRREYNRFQPGPAAVHKLGHFGLCMQHFEHLLKFYTSTFNINPTDPLYIEEDGQQRIVTMFGHLDLGETLTDHHSFFLSSNPKRAHVHHCSFEVHDFDTQQLGHQWLSQKGHRSVWGVGRHVLGSQIFDYWWDTTGNMIEQYADGDLVNNSTPIGFVNASSEALAVWGPDVPTIFME